MSEPGRNPKDRLNDAVTSFLRQHGYSGGRAAEAKREAWWWLLARRDAIAARRPLYSGLTLTWTASGYTELVPLDVPAPGAGEVTAATELTAISPGTETAQYLRLPTARVSTGHRPGFSGVGRVLEVGRGVTSVRPGDTVAVSGITHQSVFTVPERAAVVVPDGVEPAAASLVALGVIAAQGVDRAELAPDQPFILLGAGVIGVLAQRLAAADGAGPCTVVARSRRRQRFFPTADFLSLEDLVGRQHVRAPVVIEATGDPRILSLATELVDPGGRIVLLGSPRASEAPLPTARIRSKRVTVIGAHVGTLRMGETQGTDRHRAAAERFITALASRRLELSDLVDVVVDPREADLAYRRLAVGSVLGSVLFDWTLLPAPPRRRALFRIPDIQGHGVEFDGPHDLRATAPSPRQGTGSRAPTRALRIALVGCGDIAVANAAAIATVPEAQLVAYYDPDSRLAEDLRSRHGGAVAPSVEAVLDRSDVDAVFIAVPHHLHEPLATAALHAGRHVIVEKPPANDLAAAVRMARAARTAGVHLSVCFPQRYDQRVTAVRELLRRGAVGVVSGAAVSFLSDKPPSYLHGGYSGRSRSTWRTSKDQAGGGVLIMNLSHHIDLLLHLCDHAVDEVQAMVATEGPAEVEDTVSLTMRLDNGALATVLGSSAARGAFREELRLWGTAGHVEVLPTPRLFTLRAVNDTIRTCRWHTVVAVERSSARASFVAAFARAISSGEGPAIDMEAGLAVQSVIEAAYRSSTSGRAVRPAELLKENGW